MAMAELRQLAEFCTTCFLLGCMRMGMKVATYLLERSAVLKRFLSIFSDRILDSKVDSGIPSLAAAPDGPKTRPSLSRKAASIIS
jgi:hypothetical protein